MKKGDIIPIYLNPYLLLEFEGWAIILDDPELHETFLSDANNMYQVIRVKIRFLYYNELEGLRPGKYNDPFCKSFITHRRIRKLIMEDPNDDDIRNLSYSPTKKKTNGKVKNQPKD
jgi:hypothetical protein